MGQNISIMSLLAMLINIIKKMLSGLFLWTEKLFQISSKKYKSIEEAFKFQGVSASVFDFTIYTIAVIEVSQGEWHGLGRTETRTWGNTEYFWQNLGHIESPQTSRYLCFGSLLCWVLSGFLFELYRKAFVS